MCFSGDRQIRGHIDGARAGKEQSAPTAVTRQSPDVRGHSRASAARMSPPFWRRGRRGVLQHRRFVSGCCPVVVTVLIRMVCAKVLISEPSVLVCAVYVRHSDIVSGLGSKNLILNRYGSLNLRSTKTRNSNRFGAIEPGLYFPVFTLSEIYFPVFTGSGTTSH